MYQFSYAEIMEDGVADAKDRERQALTKSIDLLVEAKDSSSQRHTIEALFYTRRVWIRFIEDLKQPENQPGHGTQGKSDFDRDLDFERVRTDPETSVDEFPGYN